MSTENVSKAGMFFEGNQIPNIYQVLSKKYSLNFTQLQLFNSAIKTCYNSVELCTNMIDNARRQLLSCWKDKNRAYTGAKTFNSGYSLVVTHLTTNPPVRCLNRAERTGSLVLNVLWSNVIVTGNKRLINLRKIAATAEIFAYARSERSYLAFVT
jgi:hypothetical protein